jgi:hypothetical protein
MCGGGACKFFYIIENRGRRKKRKQKEKEENMNYQGNSMLQVLECNSVRGNYEISGREASKRLSPQVHHNFNELLSSGCPFSIDRILSGISARSLPNSSSNAGGEVKTDPFEDM